MYRAQQQIPELPRTKLMLDPDLENARRQEWWGTYLTSIMCLLPTIGYGAAPTVLQAYD